MKINNIIVVLGAALLLTGCASPPKQQINLNYVSTSQVPAEMSNQDAQLQIAEAASSVGKSLQQLSAMQMAVTPKVDVPEIDPKATGMTQVASLDWYGPVLPLLEQIARATGYQVQVLGDAPPIPVIVSMSVNSQVMADILRNVAYQAHTKATIAVNPAKKIIELRYLRA